MKEHPILFSAPMIRVLLDGSKTQTRRVVKPQPERRGDAWHVESRPASGYSPEQTMRDMLPLYCPYGGPGDRLWVRETWASHFGELHYRASEDPNGYYYGAKGWKPSIHMPRAASRITLEITSVRVERVQQISEADALAEGIDWAACNHSYAQTIGAFAALWDSINGARPGCAWADNPYVWVLTFRRI